MKKQVVKCPMIEEVLFFTPMQKFPENIQKTQNGLYVVSYITGSFWIIGLSLLSSDHTSTPELFAIPQRVSVTGAIC